MIVIRQLNNGLQNYNERDHIFYFDSMLKRNLQKEDTATFFIAVICNKYMWNDYIRKVKIPIS